ncbi:MAG: helix-turn-helix domain-containing protein [Bosea sp.]|nr:helix-turn-helix domain-containing protein [Bosea sp. (in: a-proteobacteria)]MCP4737527.1 helix-turn-helix domain-containing protein [Bosea sp. (in: a-proteobacteria)]
MPMQTALQYPHAGHAVPGAIVQKRALAFIDVPTCFKKGQTIFSEGSAALHFYEVVSGTVRTSQLLKDGRRQIDAFHLKGDLFGFEASSQHRVGAEVVEDAMLRIYQRSQLERMLAEDAEFAQRVVVAMMHAIERAQSHMLLLGRKSALERIATFLLDMSGRLSEMSHLDLPMSRSDIADHLGLTIETVSRTFTELERKGVIELPSHRRSIVLRDRTALRRLDA